MADQIREGRESPIAEPLCADNCRYKTALVLAGGGITISRNAGSTICELTVFA